MPGWDEFVETFLLTPLREGRQQFSTNPMLGFVANCRNITRFPLESTNILVWTPSKPHKLLESFAPTSREIVDGRDWR